MAAIDDNTSKQIREDSIVTRQPIYDTTHVIQMMKNTKKMAPKNKNHVLSGIVDCCAITIILVHVRLSVCCTLPNVSSRFSIVWFPALISTPIFSLSDLKLAILPNMMFCCSSLCDSICSSSEAERSRCEGRSYGDCTRCG